MISLEQVEGYLGGRLCELRGHSDRSYGMVWYGMVWYGMVWCGTYVMILRQHSDKGYSIVWYMVWRGMVWAH